MDYSEKEYARRLENFLGVDFSSSPGNVNQRRFAYLKNMYRDYESELGDAVETVPGYRHIKNFTDKVNGIFMYQPANGYQYIMVHAGAKLYRFKHTDRDALATPANVTTYTGLADAKSQAIMFNNKLYLLDGTDYWVYNGTTLAKVTTNPYIPITYVNGEQYEQRNMLSNQTINRDTEILDFNFVDLLELELISGGANISGWKEGHSGEWLITAGTFDLNGSPSTNLYSIKANAFKDDITLKKAYLSNVRPSTSSFQGCTALQEVRLYSTSDYNTTSICPDAFKNCAALTTVYLNYLSSIGYYDGENEVYHTIFDGCTALTTVYTRLTSEEWDSITPRITELLPSVAIVYNTTTPALGDIKHAMVYDPADSIQSVMVNGENTTEYGVLYKTIDSVKYVDQIVTFEDWTDDVDIKLNCKASEFTTYEGRIGFLDGNTDYSGTVIDAITKCKLIAAYDGRVFFSGNPNLPNTVLYTQRDLTGFANPTYVGVLNYVNDGTGAAVNTALLPTSGMLMVLKGDTVQDGSIYYHTGSDTSSDIIPRVYPSTQGIAGVGCLGAATNFRDDPVFISKGGLEAVGKQQVNLERTLAHRSIYVDRLLIAEDLTNAVMVEWRKYLCIFCPSGAVYLADSRQLYEHSSGDFQYEWYHMDDVGVYKDQVQQYKLTTGGVQMYDSTGATQWLNETDCWVIHDGVRKRLYVATAQDNVDYSTVYTSYVYVDDTTADVYYSDAEHTTQFEAYIAEHDGLIYLVEDDTECPYTGGTFKPATVAASINDVLYFGTANGDICVFNTDKRGVSYNSETVKSDAIHHHWYTFNGRTIDSSLSTAYDNAGVPDLAKKTVSKSMVVHTKIFTTSKFDIYVRTDRTDAWKSISTVHNSTSQFESIDFSNLALKVSDEGMNTVREKEKKWAKKQYYIVSDSHMSPFGLYHIGYRFSITGRIKG